jgi:hypothetical protein
MFGVLDSAVNRGMGGRPCEGIRIRVRLAEEKVQVEYTGGILGHCFLLPHEGSTKDMREEVMRPHLSLRAADIRSLRVV